MAASLQWRESVEIGGVQMIERVFAAADIKSIAIGQENLPAEFADIIRNYSRILRAQIGQVTKLTEMNLDGGIAIRKADLFKAGSLQQSMKLLWQRLIGTGVEVCKKHFGWIHAYHSSKNIVLDFLLIC